MTMAGLGDYAVVGCNGTSLLNSCRTSAYVQSLGIPEVKGCHCRGLCALDDEAPYTTPAEDDAWFYDENVPESAYFAGVWVTSVEGAHDSPYYRDTTQTVGGLSLLSREKVRSRTIRFRGWAAGASCCATLYGLRTFAEGLRGCDVGGCDQCAGSTWSTIDCCPDSRDAPCGDFPTFDEAADPDVFLSQHLRCLHGVAVVDGPNVLRRVGTGCGCGGSCLMEVEWTVVASNPFYHRQPVEVVDEPLPDPDGDCTGIWCDGSDGNCDCEGGPCPDPVDCATDPDCQLDTPPDVGVLEDSCVCLPLATVTECHPVDGSGLPQWGEVLPVVTITNRSAQPLRRVSVRFHQSGTVTGDCSQHEDAGAGCSACPGVLVGYIPPHSTMTLDGVDRKAYVDCQGARTATTRSIGATDGGPVNWEALTCHGDICVCVSLDAIANEDVDGQLQVEFVVREV